MDDKEFEKGLTSFLDAFIKLDPYKAMYEEDEFQKGQWVIMEHSPFGKVRRYQGYVTDRNVQDEAVEIYIVSGSSGAAVGRKVWVDEDLLTVDDEPVKRTEEVLRQLCDLALDLDDRLWFAELTTELSCLLSEADV